MPVLLLADMKSLLRRCLLLLGIVGSLSTSAGDAIGLLTAAQQAQSQQSFEGVVVFMHDGRFDAVRVVQRPGLPGARVAHPQQEAPLGRRQQQLRQGEAGGRGPHRVGQCGGGRVGVGRGAAGRVGVRHRPTRTIVA